MLVKAKHAAHKYINYIHIFFPCRPGVKALEDCLSDHQQESSSSDEDMDWSGNSSLFANLSIPQLDGAADESSGE